MLNVNNEGIVIGDAKIIAHRAIGIERGRMDKVNGIIVHQTNTDNERAVFNSYRQPKANGAHFLIAKTGVIYQTASLLFATNHVGRLKARCIVEKNCAPSEVKLLSSQDYEGIHKTEKSKAVPARFPSNTDSIGIEIVGRAVLPANKPLPLGLPQEKRERFINDHSIYETLTGAQQIALQYLVDELTQTLAIPKTEIHRHPDVSYKNTTEASTAVWR
ncbi:N-acetylmuramoyl-L-alanine amidase [Acidovorax sp. SUPP1855]|uniref:peptidoglycan recognition protein family protein n=1 Tax=Acidovorax sp. SUPP1855 TaxID=431774 RepID=UPI0023DE63C8|nr:N-acetylmuramoyl-L-alanine amidase [Acidovorax sp. SUPP1855]GKS82903.1 N-acetylmuramoyl-L-alanine amidase [Acidovorax sp. SUPP1855]